MHEPVYYRDHRLVLGILGLVYDADRPVPWNEVVQALDGAEWAWRTVEGAMYDLVRFGALHRVGKARDGRRGDTRALKPTALGRAWLDGEVMPRPSGNSTARDGAKT